MNDIVKLNDIDGIKEFEDKINNPITNEHYIIACILRSDTNGELKKDILNLVASYWESKAFTPTATKEAWHSIEKLIVRLIKTRFPESFTGNFFR